MHDVTDDLALPCGAEMPGLSNGFRHADENIAAEPFGMRRICVIESNHIGWTPMPEVRFVQLADGRTIDQVNAQFIVLPSQRAFKERADDCAKVCALDFPGPLAVPQDQREASLALGATRWETTWNVVVPHAKAGIIGSIFLALARALGETMAVTMVIGNDPKINLSLLAPGYSIAAAIANEFTEATSDMHISALIELGLVLFCITIVVNAVARLLILTTTRRTKA